MDVLNHSDHFSSESAESRDVWNDGLLVLKKRDVARLPNGDLSFCFICVTPEVMMTPFGDTRPTKGSSSCPTRKVLREML